jgi:hypothetical protein
MARGERRLAEERAGLYAGSLSGFTGARSERARQLRGSGDKELAAAVAKLPKPTVAAWAVDQVAHHYRHELKAFLDAGKAVRDAQARLLRGRGSRDTLEAALEEERRQVRSLAELARGLLADAGQKPTQATLEKVRETLHAATLDEAIAEDVAAGALEKEQRSSGFDAILSMPVGRSSKPAKGGTSSSSRRRRGAPPEADEQAERAAAEERKARLEAARAELRDAREEAAERRKELRAAEQTADDAREALREAEERLESAEDALGELRES